VFLQTGILRSSDGKQETFLKATETDVTFDTFVLHIKLQQELKECTYFGELTISSETNKCAASL